MLNVKCNHRAAKPSSSTVRYALISTLLSLSLVQPGLTFASQDRDSLVFIPENIANTADKGRLTQSVSNRVYQNLMTPASLQSLSAGYREAVMSDGVISNYQDRMFTIESQAGPFSGELTEVLHSLGNLYLDQHMYDEALESFAREEHINRVNHGLYSETLLPAVKSQIHVLDLSGRRDEADDKQRYLIHLLERCYGPTDTRLLPDLINYAEWNLDQFHDIIRYEFKDVANVALNGGATTRDAFREQAFENLDVAAQLYARAVKLLVTHEQFSNPTLFQLENRLIELSYFQAARREMINDPDNFHHRLDMENEMYSNGPYARLTRDSYSYGLESYKRQLAYMQKDPEAKMAHYIDVLMAMGDWYMLFGKPQSGYNKYREARDLMVKLNIREASMDSILSPQVPAQIPAFTATPHSLASLDQHGTVLSPYQGYIDVSFRVNRNGNARDVEVLEVSSDTSPEVEKELKKTLKRARFRPRFDEADVKQDDQVAMRYYYAYEDSAS